MGVQVSLEQGSRYGSLVIQRTQEPRPSQKRSTRIWCDCDCGARNVETSYLALQLGKSDCGDLIHKERDLPEKGTLFGGAEFIEFAGFKEKRTNSSRDGVYTSRREQWRMKCPCGEKFLIKKCDLLDRLEKGTNGGKIFCRYGCRGRHGLFLGVELPKKGTLFGGAEFLEFAGFKEYRTNSSRDGDVIHQYPVWRMKCSCGEIFTIPRLEVFTRLGKGSREGQVLCDKVALNHSDYKIGDELGYLRLTALRIKNNNRGHPRLIGIYTCSACGRVDYEATPSKLVGTKTASCGCMRTEANVIHGLTRKGVYSREYNMFQSARKRAKRSKVPFHIQIEDIIIPDICPILGITFIKKTKVQEDASPSLDKIVPQQGYVKGNIQVISYLANRLKNNGAPEEWEKVLKWLEKVYGELPDDLKQRLREGVPPATNLINGPQTRINHGLSSQKPKEIYIWWSAKHRARKEQREGRGTPFDLHPLDIVIPATCPILGIPIDRDVRIKRTENSPTIDRLIPVLGYVRGNIHMLSWRGNRIKNSGSLDNWRKVVAWSKREKIVERFRAAQHMKK